MRYTYMLWALTFVMVFIFGGLFVAVGATVLAVGSSITTGLSTTSKLNELSTTERKMLGR